MSPSGSWRKAPFWAPFLAAHRKGPSRIETGQVSAGCGLGPVSRGVFTDPPQLLLRQRHAGGADIGDALAELVVGHGLEPVRSGIGEILAHAAVEVYVHQTGNHIAAGGVQRLAAGRERR